MGDRLVQLSSRSHHDNILGCLHQLRLVGQLVDITVQVDHQGTGELEEFQAHQVILAASSGYFKRLLLSQDPVPDKLFLSNIRTANFSKFLEFVYTGKVEVARDKIGDVREAARLLDCQDLSEVCEEAMVAGDSREPDKGACSPSSDPERAGVDGAERKRPLKRKLSLKSSKRGLNRPKMLRAIEVAKGKEVQSEEAGIRRLSIRLAGHKIPMGVLVHEWKVENEENGDQDTHLETKTQKESPEKMGEEFPATDLASDGDNHDEEGEEEDEGNIMNDDPNDPLYMSPEDDGEEGDSLRTLKKTPKAQFQCDKCLRAFHYERSYLKHISTYHGVKAEVVYRCETCQQTFANRGNLKIHEKHVHSDERLFACQICAKSFKRKKDVIRHQRQVHEGIGIRHVCPDCGKTLSSKTALLLHERTHSGLKPFQCTVCAAKFTQSSALKMHLRTHTGEKPFACDLCEARFTQKHMLCYHKRSHTGEKPFMCEACGKSFASKEYLRHHSNIHTGSRPYKCEQCGRGFAQRNSLHQHLKIHTGERPYSCKDCDKQFTQLNALQRHQRIHTGEKPYMCGLCNRTFTDKSTVRRHTMTHDTDAPWKNYLVVLDGNVEGKKPKGSGEKSDAGELQVHVGGVAADHEGAKAPTAEAMVVPEEPVSLPAGWAQHGTISLVSHGALGGITVIHTADMPPGTHLQPLVTADGTSIISLDSSISMPFSLPVSMAHPVPAVSTMSSTIPVSLTLPMISSSSTASVPTASVLEAAVSQTILAPPSEVEEEDEAHINLSEPDIHTVVISEKHCSNLKQRDDVVAPDEGRERTAEETSADKEDTSTEDAV